MTLSEGMGWGVGWFGGGGVLVLSFVLQEVF